MPLPVEKTHCEGVQRLQNKPIHKSDHVVDFPRKMLEMHKLAAEPIDIVVTSILTPQEYSGFYSSILFQRLEDILIFPILFPPLI